MNYDYLIVGQGLAGSILALKLIELDKKIVVINDPTKVSSSSVAGGMFNPVTGKHLAKTWLAESLFPELHTFYAGMEKKLGSNFYHPGTVYRPFINESQKDQFLSAISKHQLEEYVNPRAQNESYEKYIKNPLGGIRISQAGWLDVPKFIEKVRLFLQKKAAYREDKIEYNSLISNNQSIDYKEDTYKKVIFCEGFYASQNPLWKWLPFNPVKGESLLCKIADYQIQEIVNQGVWIIPMNNGTYRLGATYTWHELNFENTEKAREELKTKVSKFLKSNFEILGQQAGVRPSISDRRPIMGSHPENPNLYIFNGLGTKGVSIGPYMADRFIDFLEKQKELTEDTTIERFYPLY